MTLYAKTLIALLILIACAIRLFAWLKKFYYFQKFLVILILILNAALVLWAYKLFLHYSIKLFAKNVNNSIFCFSEDREFFLKDVSTLLDFHNGIKSLAVLTLSFFVSAYLVLYKSSTKDECKYIFIFYTYVVLLVFAINAANIIFFFFWYKMLNITFHFLTKTWLKEGKGLKVPRFKYRIIWLSELCLFLLLTFLFYTFNIYNLNKLDCSKIYSCAGNTKYTVFNFTYSLVDLCLLAAIFIIFLRVVQYTIFVQLFKKVGGPVYFSALFSTSLLTLIDLVLMKRFCFLVELAIYGQTILMITAVSFILLVFLVTFKKWNFNTIYAYTLVSSVGYLIYFLAFCVSSESSYHELTVLIIIYLFISFLLALFINIVSLKGPTVNNFFKLSVLFSVYIFLSIISIAAIILCLLINYLVSYNILIGYLALKNYSYSNISTFFSVLDIFKTLTLLVFFKLIFFVFFKIKDNFKRLSLVKKNFIYSYLLKKDISSKKLGRKSISISISIFLFLFIFATYWTFVLYATSATTLFADSIIFLFFKRNFSTIKRVVLFIYNLFK